VIMKEISKQVLTRFKVIEHMVYWEGGVNATRLSNYFGVGVNVITSVLAKYRQIHPDNIHFDGKDPEKICVPTKMFEAHYISTSWDDYVSTVLVNNANYINKTYGADSFLSTLPSLQKPKPEVTRVLLKAIRTGRKITLKYKSRSTPEGSKREIAPHALASDGLRWHCRAYCHKRQRFSDFNLGRMEAVELLNKSEINHKEDTAWSTFVNVEIGPHPDLNQAEQQLVLNDFNYDKPFAMPIRGALVDYTLQFYRIAKSVEESNKRATPLVVLNLEDLKPYLFSGEK